MTTLLTNEIDIHPEVFALLDRSCNFTLKLLTWEQNWENETSPREVHETVLRPLLAAADECWAYGLEPDSPAFNAAPVLAKDKSRYKVDLSGDPIRGHEFFWNAHGGKRGTVLITLPLGTFDLAKIYPNCIGHMVFRNYRAGHSPSAITYAQRKIQDNKHIVVCLPRNNGLQWMEVFAPKPLVFSLYQDAMKEVRKLNEA